MFSKTLVKNTIFIVSVIQHKSAKKKKHKTFQGEIFGHNKPISQLKLNRDGDLLFVSSLGAGGATEPLLTVWDPLSGEWLGSFEGHSGAVTDLDVDLKSQYLISSSNDSTVKIWDVNNGKALYTFNFTAQCRTVSWSSDMRFFVTATRPFGGKGAQIHIGENPILEGADKVDEGDSKETERDAKSMKATIDFNENTGVQSTRVLWSPLDEQVFTCCTDGTIRVFDVTKQKEIKSVVFDPKFSEKSKLADEISPSLTDMKYVNNHSAVIISSRNKEAKVFDIEKWDVIRTYSTDRPLNTVAVHPTANVVALGGGQQAQQAALSDREGLYECLFHHLIFEERIGLIPCVEKEVFSPLNAMSFSPDGNIFALGYEQGQVCVYQMDDSFQNTVQQIEKRFITEEEEEEL
ncbi:eukaryotic translation initiation factor 3 39 kDa subunit [Reticulomyxa filosa]|uniref:Serine-threonine kinase receptor-associated protein n=1 Tax=Reticulomyxa filosa TaxID=46433 RepID=X6MN99_RETFI|nr:eukaryotic translation initiation factor 3 39 kDa subunit [Reticulomyxa filosa]|eukprot:ETO15151.1 eukaryotic translation initiation factor 3 39 kDa subunit [Reticulomyxa filosa]